MIDEYAVGGTSGGETYKVRSTRHLLKRCPHSAVISTLIIIVVIVCPHKVQAETDKSHTDWVTCLSRPAPACLLTNALQLTRSISAPTVRIHSLLAIAAAQMDAGMAQESRTIFSEALEIAKSSDGEERYSLLEAIAFAQARAGLAQESIATFDQSRPGKERSDWARSLRAQIYALNGNFEEALQLVRSIQDETEKITPLFEIAKARMRNKMAGAPGLLAEAEDIIRSHTEVYPRFRIFWLCDISDALVDAKQAHTARSVLRLAGTIAQSRRAFDDQPKRRARWLARLAAEQTKAGMTAAATSNFVRALHAVRLEKIAMGKDEENTALEALRFVIQQQADLRPPKQVAPNVLSRSRNLALSFHPAGYRAELLADIAEAEAKNGLRKRAFKTFHRALQIARIGGGNSYDRGDKNNKVFNHIIAVQARGGFSTEAITALSHIREGLPDEMRIEALCALAESIVTQGQEPKQRSRD